MKLVITEDRCSENHAFFSMTIDNKPVVSISYTGSEEKFFDDCFEITYNDEKMVMRTIHGAEEKNLRQYFQTAKKHPKSVTFTTHDKAGIGLVCTSCKRIGFTKIHRWFECYRPTNTFKLHWDGHGRAPVWLHDTLVATINQPLTNQEYMQQFESDLYEDNSCSTAETIYPVIYFILYQWYRNTKSMR